MSSHRAEWIKITDCLLSQVATAKTGRGGPESGVDASQLATHRQAGQQSSQVETKGHRPEIRALIVGVRRSVAIAKLVEFESQAMLLGGYVSADMMPMPVAADALHDVALANDLTSIHGDDLIQAIIAAGLSGGCL